MQLGTCKQGRARGSETESRGRSRAVEDKKRQARAMRHLERGRALLRSGLDALIPESTLGNATLCLNVCTCYTFSEVGKAPESAIVRGRNKRSATSHTSVKSRQENPPSLGFAAILSNAETRVTGEKFRVNTETVPGPSPSTCFSVDGN